MKPASNARSLKRPVTLKTLAAHLDLDPATISVVLNEVPGRSIPHNTRERIKAAARALGYSPNLLAKSLRTRRARIIGVVLPDVASSYHAQILSGIAHHLAQFSYCCMVLPHGYNSALITQHLDSLIQRRAEGFIAIDTVFDHAPELLTVAIGCQSHTTGTTVIKMNENRAVALALEFFLSRGHRELLLVQTEHPDLRSSRLAHIVRESAAAYGLQVAEEPHGGPSMDRIEAVMALDADSARIAKRDCSAADRNVCIVCIDLERPSVLDASVTVVREPLRTMGQMAAEILMQKIVSDRPLPDLIRVEPEIVSNAPSEAVAPPAYAVFKAPAAL